MIKSVENNSENLGKMRKRKTIKNVSKNKNEDIKLREEKNEHRDGRITCHDQIKGWSTGGKGEE